MITHLVLQGGEKDIFFNRTLSPLKGPSEESHLDEGQIPWLQFQICAPQC